MVLVDIQDVPAMPPPLCEGDADNGLCAPGGPEVVQKIRELLGGGAVTLVPKVAMVHCNGAPNILSQKMDS